MLLAWFFKDIFFCSLSSVVATVAAGPLMKDPCRGAISSLAPWVVVILVACCSVVAFGGARMCASLHWQRNTGVGSIIKADQVVPRDSLGEGVSSVVDDITLSSPRVANITTNEQRALLGRQATAKQQLKRRPDRQQNSS